MRQIELGKLILNFSIIHLRRRPGSEPLLRFKRHISWRTESIN